MKKHIQHTILLTVIAAAAILIPTVLVASGVIDEYIAGILSQAGVYAIMAISVNLISGITGQLSLGQAGFMALGTNQQSLPCVRCAQELRLFLQ